MGEHGWRFADTPGCIADTVNGCDYLHQSYTLAQPRYSGRGTVPVLFDKETGTIVNNESAEIIEMLNSAFDAYGDATVNFFPAERRAEMDAVNSEIYTHINDGVYRAGFATRQAAYEEAYDSLFALLDQIETRLARQRYLLGARITAADWRLFTTLLRFDAVYYSHFKSNLRRVGDYSHLSEYVRDLYQVPGVASAVNMSHIKIHNNRSHPTIN